MRHRFYAADAARGLQTITLPEDEADHLRRVLRLRADDEIRVFDGEGHEFDARVTTVDGRAVHVVIGAPVQPARETRTRLTLVQSALKGDKFDDVIRDAVMLGVSIIQPIVSARSEFSADVLARRADRWSRIALASTKQSGRATRTWIAPPRTFDEWLAAPRDRLRLMLVEPDAVRDAVRTVREVIIAMPTSASVLVGPEGGWTPEEVDKAASAAVTLVTLGPRTLRADAVALVALSMLLVAWD